MGRMQNWGNAFGRWYYAQGKGKQFLLCLGVMSPVVYGMMLMFPMPEQHPDNALKVPCPTRSDVYISLDDPQFDENDLTGTVRVACERAGDPRW